MADIKGMMAMQNKANLALKVGCLVFDEDRGQMFFCDATGKYFEKGNIYSLSNERNHENGVKDLPKPFVVKKEKITEVGDNLFYTYVDEAEQNILILGSSTKWDIDTFDSFLKLDDTKIESVREKYFSRDNKQRFFSVSDDGKGNVAINIVGKKNDEEPGTGNLTIKVTGTDENGNVNLSLNGKFAITQTQVDGETETAIAQMLFDNTKDAEKIKIIDKAKNRVELNKDGMIFETATIRIGKTETIKKIFDDLISAILNMTQGTAAGGPTIATKFNVAEFQAISNRLAQFMDNQ